MHPSSLYSFATCQHGAEPLLKGYLCEPSGSYRLSFSQNGFVTLKSRNLSDPWSPELPGGPFVRSRGHAIERLEASSAQELVSETIDRFCQLDWNVVHVWERDASEVGWRGFEPGESAVARDVAQRLGLALQSIHDVRAPSVNQLVEPGQRILDVVLVQPNRWWIGTHPVVERTDGWPGGAFTIVPPANMISRAYLKLAEAIAWSGLPMRPGESVVEIGSSPGGACQRLLDLGLHVTGVDPAAMSPVILEHPRFTHIRARSPQVKRRAFRSFKWLVCDANVAPRYTLDTVEGIVTYPTTQIEGMLLTIKLSDWQQAGELPNHLARVASWGYSAVQARQLSHNRREYCIAASR